MRNQMPTFQFEMAPLDEFVVTERHYPNRKDLPTILLADWFNSFPDWPQYQQDFDTKTIIIEEDEPTDCKPVYHDYKLIYVGKK